MVAFRCSKISRPRYPSYAVSWVFDNCMPRRASLTWCRGQQLFQDVYENGLRWQSRIGVGLSGRKIFLPCFLHTGLALCGEGLVNLPMVLTVLVVLGREIRIILMVWMSLSNPMGSCRVKWLDTFLGRILSMIL